MPKRKKTKTTQSKPIAILDAPANPDKISLKTWQVYAAQSAFVLLDKKPDAHNIDFLILKKHFENYVISKEGTKLKAEIEQVRFKTRTNPEFEKLFDNACDLEDQDIQKMATVLEIESVLSDLKQKEYSLQLSTIKEIFVLMNAFLPYYSQDSRNSWNLASLFKSCEKMHGLYFHSLKQLVSIDSDIPLFKQMQATYLCAMMMWVSNTRSELELQFKLIMLAFNTLEKCQHFNQMLAADYPLDSDYKSLILPSPLSIVDTIYTYYENLHKENTLLPILKNLKERLLNLGDKQSLRLPLLEELIFFLDKILDVGLSSAASLDQKVDLFDKYKSYQGIMEKMQLSYDLLMNKEHLISVYMQKLFDPNIDKQKLQKTTKERILKKYIAKLNASENKDLNSRLEILKNNLTEHNIFGSIAEFTQLYIDKNIDDDIIEIFVDEESTFLVWKKLHELSIKWKELKNTISEYEKNAAQFSSELIEEDGSKKIKETEELEAKLATLNKKKTDIVARKFNEDQLKKVEDESVARTQQEERLKQNRLSALDQIQQTISASLDDIAQPSEKEQQIISDIYKHLGYENLGLESLKHTILSIGPRLQDIHIILILLSSLFDNFTSQLQNNLRIYQKKYSAAILNTTDKFGTRFFNQTDHDNNKHINASLPEIITLISEMEVYAEKALMTLQIIKNLRNQIQDNTHYHAWDKAEKFRTLEYSDIHKKVSLNFGQFEKNRMSKERAYFSGQIPSPKKTNIPKPIKETEVSERLVALKQSFEKLNEKIKECLLIIQPMHNQMHEVLDLSHNVSHLNLSTNTEVKTRISQFFRQQFNPKTTVERKQILLTALHHLLDEKYDLLKENILSEINKDQTIDDKKFRDLFKSIQDKINVIPTMGRSLSF